MSLFDVLPSIDELEKKAADKVISELKSKGISDVAHIGTWRWYEETEHLSFVPAPEFMDRLKRGDE